MEWNLEEWIHMHSGLMRKVSLGDKLSKKSLVRKFTLVRKVSRKNISRGNRSRKIKSLSKKIISRRKISRTLRMFMVMCVYQTQ